MHLWKVRLCSAGRSNPVVDFLSRPKSAESENPSRSTATTRSRSEGRGLPLGLSGETRRASGAGRLLFARAENKIDGFGP